MRQALARKPANNAINTDVQKRRFALLLHAGYGERYVLKGVLSDMKNHLPIGEELQKRAEELGVVLSADDPNESSGSYEMFRSKVSAAELQKRVIEAERHLQSQKMMVIAIIAATSSLVSAIAAWCAILIKGV